MPKYFKTGFTLIELLVVIAIIGVLSSIVLSSLNSSRSKGSDAAIKASVSAIRSAAEIYHANNNNSYGTQSPMISTCGASAAGVAGDTDVQKYIDDSVTRNGGTDAKCQSNGTAYVVAIPLKSTPANAWCVDSDGRSQQIVFATLATNMDCSLVASSL